MRIRTLLKVKIKVTHGILWLRFCLHFTHALCGVGWREFQGSSAFRLCHSFCLAALKDNWFEAMLPLKIFPIWEIHIYHASHAHTTTIINLSVLSRIKFFLQFYPWAIVISLILNTIFQKLGKPIVYWNTF